jgi:hypothetical protein
VQFQISPTLRFPGPRLVIWLFIFLDKPVVLPVMFSAPFLNHHHCTVNVVLSMSPGVALQSKVDEIFGEAGTIIGMVMFGAVFWIVTVLLVNPLYRLPSNDLTVQFQVSPTVVLPLPRMLMMVLLSLATLLLPHTIGVEVPLYHQNSTINDVFSTSPAVALQFISMLESGSVGNKIGVVIFGAVLLEIIVSVLEFRVDE